MERNKRKTVEGVVISSKMDKTVIVNVVTRIRHPVYGKIVDRRKKFYAHDESNAIQEGARVKIMETRPLSKSKRWRVIEVCEEKAEEKK